MTQAIPQDLVIVGGGISGSALLFAAARYTAIERITLLEKYPQLASVNSAASHNSQTLHCGDIETNYTLEKALVVQRAAAMITRYAEHAPDRQQFLFRFPKMVLAVGEEEVNKLRQRFERFSPHYSRMQWLDKPAIARIEPNVVKNGAGERPEPLGACATLDDFCAVDYGALAHSFVQRARQEKNSTRVELDWPVSDIERSGELFQIKSSRGTIMAKSVVVAAGGHSLLFAQRLGHGLQFSVLPVGGSFYFAPQVLNGKVYTLQNDKLPFAAVHGDPDVGAPGKTRFGPTAVVLPMLERYRPESIADYFRVAHLDYHVVKVLGGLLKDSDIRRYMGKNMLYEVPVLRRRLFLQDARKIVPGLRLEDLRFAPRTGGIRPQLIDKTTDKLLLGEAMISTKEGILFNMTPSPGATSCLANAENDLESITEFLQVRFDRDRFAAELKRPVG